MKSISTNKRTILSIATTIGIILFSIFIIMGEKYLDENYIQNNINQMFKIYNQIPDPVPRRDEKYFIDKRWIVKSVIAYRCYPHLSTIDGITFFSNYAKNNSWKIIRSRWDVDKGRNTRTYYLTIKKNEFVCYIENEENSDRWRIWIQKEDIFKKLGL